MATPVGAQGHLGVLVESSYGSGGNPSTWIPFNSESLTPTYANVYSDKVRSTSEQVGGQRGNESVAGDIALSITPQFPAAIWNVVLGQSSSPYYTERPIKTLMLEIDKETAAVQASGCAVGSTTISSAQGEELVMTMSIEGKAMASRVAGSPSYTADDNPYLHSDATFTLEGTEDTSITAWSITIDNNLVTDLFGTDRFRLDIPAGKCVVVGSFTKLFDDTIERNAFFSGDVRTLKVNYSRGTRSLIFWCEKIRHDSRPANIGGQSEYILETFNFTCFTDDPTREWGLRISGDTT